MKPFLIMLAVLAAAGVAAYVYGRVYAARAEARWPAEGRLIETAAGPIHVVEAGAGPRAVVLVHGASANTRELRSALEDPLVAVGFRVVAFDRPGFGASPAFARADRLAGHADALQAVIEAEGLDRPIVVGHSYGGAVALRHALDHPGAGGGYVLLGPATHGDVGPVAWHNHVAATPVLGWFFTRLVVPIAGPPAGGPGVEATFAPSLAPEGHAEETGVGLLFRPESFEANARDLHAVNAELLEQQARYADIAAPVAIIAGVEDRTVNTARHSERAAAAIPDARLALLPGVGHMPHHAAPDLVVEHVVALADTVDGAAP